MNINIKPLNKIITTDGIHAVGFEMYDPKAVEKLEADFKEVVEKLYKLTIESINNSWEIAISKHHDNPKNYAHYQNKEYMATIEKATGQKWEDIK